MDNNKKKNVPEIRFPGFTDPWEQRKLGTVVDVCSGKDYKHLAEGNIPVYGTGGYMLSVSEALSQQDAIGIGRKGTIDNPYILKAPFWTVDTLFYCIPKSCDLDFVYALYQTINWRSMDESTGVPSLSKTAINDVEIHVPSVDEQHCIGELFSNLDATITLHQRKCDELKIYKKGLLQQMFPQPGESIPRVRFPGFTDPWEQRKLEDIFTERHILSKITKEYPRLSFTIEEGVIHPEDRKTNKRDFLMKDESNKKFLVTELEDIIYNPANVVWGALHRNTYGKGCLSPIYKIFSTDENPAFIECILRSPSFIRALSQKTEGTVVKLKTLKPEAFLEMSISVAPQRAEQDAIAAVFEQIDNLITLHQRKCDELKTYKKGLLQKMFV